MKYEDLSTMLEVTHIGTDGQAYTVDETHPANAYTSRRLDGSGHALLVDIDHAEHRAVDGWWLLESLGQMPSLSFSLNQLTDHLRLTSGAQIAVPHVTVASHTRGHQHLYLLGELTEAQLVLAHAALVYAGVEGWGNLFQVMHRGYSALYFPGTKATRPGRNSGGAK